MDKRFLTAFLAPPNRKVGGFVLDAFNLRHYITLECLESPFVTMDRAPTPEDIIMVIKVFSTKNWKDIKKISIIEKWKFSKLLNSVEAQVEVSLELQEFLKESMSIPKLWNKITPNEINQKKEPMHKSIVLVSILMCKFGFSEEEAWNMPISKVVWYVTAYSLLEGGDIQTISTSEEEAEEEDKIRLQKAQDEALKTISKTFKMNVKTT